MFPATALEPGALLAPRGKGGGAGHLRGGVGGGGRAGVIGGRLREGRGGGEGEEVVRECVGPDSQGDTHHVLFIV